MSSAHIDVSSLTAATWTLAAAATVATAGRYIIRFRIQGNFCSDDVAHLLAWIFMIAYSAVTQATFSSAEQLLSVASPPADAVVSFRKHQEALTMLFILSLWFVKFAFMFLYRLLFWASPTFQKLWWGVMVILLITVWVPIAGNLTDCGPVSRIYDPEACLVNVKYQQTVLEYVCGVHLGTDFLVMVLPGYIIRKLQMTLSKKLGLVAVFSVALVTVAFDILRTVKSLDQGAFSASSLYTSLEVTFAIIASCLPVYRAMLRTARKTKASDDANCGFSPIKEGIEQQPVTKRGLLEYAPNEGPRSPFAEYIKRSSLATVTNISSNRSDESSESQHGYGAPHVLAELPPAHFRSSSIYSVQESPVI